MSNHYDAYEVLTFKRLCVKFHDISISQKKAAIVIFKTMDSKQLRVLIYHCFLMKTNAVQAQQWLQKCYPDSAPSKRTICYWFAEFKRGRTDTDDGERSVRPIEVVTTENIKIVHKLIISDRKLKSREIAETVKISEAVCLQ